jgi:hypothetical protein
LEKGLYENCINCGSHRIFETEAYMFDGEITVPGDKLFFAAKEAFKFENELDKYNDIKKEREEIRLKAIEIREKWLRR